jgi:hypothetical protein
MRFLSCCLTGIAALVAAAVPSTAAEPQLLSQELIDQGWVELFDGETLFGLQRVGDAEWQVEDGTVTTQGDKAGWLMTTTEWGDFELHVEFKSPAATNSGVFLRTASSPTDPTKDCYELNIAPKDNPFPGGKAKVSWNRRLWLSAVQIYATKTISQVDRC